MTVSSTFSGTENPLSEGGVWSTAPGVWGAMRKANGAFCTATLTDCASVYAAGLTADQYSEITIADVAGAQVMFHYANVRTNASGLYQVTTAADVGPNVLVILRWDAAHGETQLGANITTPANVQTGDVMRLEVVGSLLTVKWNGAILRTQSDSTFATGQPGIGGWVHTSGSGVNARLISSWSAGDVLPAAAPPVVPPRTPNYRFSI